jgi:predicted  nucleic acid-binding Zn-ribbon protein
LYRTDLHPEHIPGSADNGLYGVSLSVDRIEGQPFSPEDYEKEQSAKKTRIQELRRSLSEKAIEKEETLKNTNEYYNKKLSSIKEQIAKLDLDNTTRSTKINRIKDAIQELSEKSKSEKERQLAELHEKESKKSEEIILLLHRIFT